MKIDIFLVHVEPCRPQYSRNFNIKASSFTTL